MYRILHAKRLVKHAGTYYNFDFLTNCCLGHQSGCGMTSFDTIKTIHMQCSLNLLLDYFLDNPVCLLSVLLGK